MTQARVWSQGGNHRSVQNCVMTNHGLSLKIRKGSQEWGWQLGSKRRDVETRGLDEVSKG